MPRKSGVVAQGWITAMHLCRVSLALDLETAVGAEYFSTGAVRHETLSAL